MALSYEKLVAILKSSRLLKYIEVVSVVSELSWSIWGKYLVKLLMGCLIYCGDQAQIHGISGATSL